MKERDIKFKCVSIIIPILNEHDTLPSAIKTLTENGYPVNKLEFVLIDGGSTDGTLAYLHELAQTNLDVKIINNPNRTTPYALNLGIEASTHPIILRADAHALYHKEYIKLSVDDLINGCGDNVGGRLFAIPSNSVFSVILSIVLNSKLGNGGADYRNSLTGKLVDTVWCGCWYKQVLVEEGMFDTNWITNQDGEINARFRKSGRTIYCNPKIVAELRVRQTYEEMLKQYYYYGKGRMKTLLKYPTLIRIRQLIPFLTVIITLSIVIIMPIFSLLLFIIMNLLCFFIFLSEQRSSEASTPNLLWVVPIIIGMNFSWVIGSLAMLTHLDSN